MALLATAAVLLGADAAAAASEQPRRIAVVVGANQAPLGRTTLRYGHADARSVAAALTDVAGFAPADVHVLLDPDPDTVLGRLDAALANLAGTREALLLFYFSGHSDAGALYPAGRPLPLGELKRRLEDPRASMRVGVVDACSGGAWTGTKGLHSAEPFVVDVPFTLGAEGSALVAASSGAENAHEYEGIGGSFFTHHFVAGLRGAAERDGDGVVSLGEAFDFAKAGTLRDSALYAPSPQHPSFVMNLRGRSDLPLARLAGADTRIDVVQQQGPLEVIRLDQALVVLELPPGRRTTTLALPPGKYVVRRRAGGETFAAEVQLVAGRPVELREEALILVGSPELASKGTGPSPLLTTTLPGGTWEVGIAMGLKFDDFANSTEPGLHAVPRVAVGLSDRWQLGLVAPHLAVRLGEPDATEAVVFVGTKRFRRNANDAWIAMPGTGVALRQHLGGGHAVLASLSGHTWVVWGKSHGPTTFEQEQVDAALGWSWTMGRLTLTPSVGFRGLWESSGNQNYAGSLVLGSEVGIPGHSRPLLQFRLGEGWAVEGHASLAWHPVLDRSDALYSLGTSWTF